jgi:HEPN domain-containing protein
MEEKKIDTQKLIDYWVQASDEDFDTMITMQLNKKYNWSLFIGHLVIEKLLKALFVSINKEHPPLIHNLLRLAEKSQISITEEQRLFLITVTAFNINARYDDYKMSFQKKCTAEFAEKWIEQIKTQRIWIKELIAQ